MAGEGGARSIAAIILRLCGAGQRRLRAIAPRTASAAAAETLAEKILLVKILALVKRLPYMKQRFRPLPMSHQDTEITATILRERVKLGHFIRRRIGDAGDADDILQDVFHEFVQACRLPAPIEQASAWLYRVARNRIVDRFRKKKELALHELHPLAGDDDGWADDYLLDLALPAASEGPEAAYARSVLLQELQLALDELPAEQRDVFIQHELEGLSFKEIAAHSGVPLNTLLARKRYAVLQLRRRLQSIYDQFDT